MSREISSAEVSPEEIKANARGAWPLVALVLLGGYFDFLLKGEPAVALIGVAVGLVPILLRRVVGPVLTKLGNATGIPSQYRKPLAVGVPLAVVYMARWSGTQSSAMAMATMAVPIVTALVLANRREQLEQSLSSWFEWREETIPRAVQLGLVVAAPVLITFLFIHGAPLDLIAFFGGETSSPAPVADRTLLIPVGTALSTVAVFLLAHRPSTASSDAATEPRFDR
ncbi:MAG: hypothetical protein GY720_03750 [bacterium]|nr:hypothetical protein [bacterium]